MQQIAAIDRNSPPHRWPNLPFPTPDGSGDFVSNPRRRTVQRLQRSKRADGDAIIQLSKQRSSLSVRLRILLRAPFLKKDNRGPCWDKHRPLATSDVRYSSLLSDANHLVIDLLPPSGRDPHRVFLPIYPWLGCPWRLASPPTTASIEQRMQATNVD